MAGKTEKVKLKKFIREIQDFPKEGILYRDIQPLLEDPKAFEKAVYKMLRQIDLEKVDYFVGIESRGFIFATAMAWVADVGVKLIRKEGKLPNTHTPLHRVEYDLEYGSAAIEMEGGKGKVVIVDDVLATGGTIQAARQLATNAGYKVKDCICLVDIGILKEHDIKCIISY